MNADYRNIFIKILILNLYICILRYIYHDLSFSVQSQMRSNLSNGPDEGSLLTHIRKVAVGT